MNRKRITLYYQPKVGRHVAKDILIDEDLHSPKCLSAIAQAMYALNNDFVLLVSEKYGCRQFIP